MKAIENHQGFRLRFGEFPDLLFTVTDARTYFDMTHFLQSMKLEPEEKITEFTEGFALWIEHLGKMYGIQPGRNALPVGCPRRGHFSGRERIPFALCPFPSAVPDPPYLGVYLLGKACLR